MSLSNKILLAAKKPLTLASWRGYAVLNLTYWDDLFCSFNYTRFFEDEGSGSLTPFLETVKTDTQLFSINLIIDNFGSKLSEAYMNFCDVSTPPSYNYRRFEGLSKCTIYSETGGDPFVITDMDSYYDPSITLYNIYSGDLAEWGYENLRIKIVAGEEILEGVTIEQALSGEVLADGIIIDFNMELEWYE